MTDQPSREEVLAQSEAALARFKEGLPAAREVTTTGELAAILAALPADTPLFLGEHLVARPDLSYGTDVVQTVVAHLTPSAESTDPDDPDDLDSIHQMMPALGLTTLYLTQGHDGGEEFEQHSLQPVDSWARAEERLLDGDLDGGIRDAAGAVANIARRLAEGAEFIPKDHDAHATIRVEITRLEAAAERLGKIAPIAQEASE
ncbi:MULTISPECIES: hypothetical protein [unclassified Streptomyces]|uniref:hypothetical protein n=1 Tax=unclassified Streptomyces TaxID=2593676 RepID=UPI0036E6FDBD